MRVARHDEARSILLVVEGEVDVMTAPRLRAALFDALADDTARAVVLDLTRVDLLASAGLSAMSEARQTAKRLNEPLRVVVDHSRPVLRPLQATGLDRWFELYHTVTDALAQ
jgi:anti-sigma B factor antagonist